MTTENGEWIMKGIPDSDPRCIKSVDELAEHIDEIGFLPLFSCGIEGFSVEEMTDPRYWWTEHERDPWLWRELIARDGRIAYGKFFDKRAGFISLRWLPYFANFRRDGYDFDSRWEDGMATARQKLIMDLFMAGDELFSFEAKRKAGFGKGGEKNFEGILTELQMQTYLVTKDFRQRRNRNGEPYGWKIAVYSSPEGIWGYDAVTSAYNEAPAISKQRIISRIRELFPDAAENRINKILK